MKKLRLRDWLPITLYFMFGLGLLLYFRMSGMLEQFDIQALSDWVRNQGLTGMLLYVLAYTVRPLVFFPASLLTVFGGYTYGPWLGTLLDVIGAGTGGLLSFWIARLLGRRGVEKLIGKGKLNVLDERIATNGFLVVLIVRLIPLFPFDAISYASGLSKIRFKQFAIANYIGIIPGAFVYNNIGSSLRDPFSWQFFLAIGLYVLFFAVGLVAQQILKNKQKKERM
ncbi:MULTISPECIES: TVP38/TMEM64 family protein [unclassified Exiguobacterium]|uniref:TVP38/TMEM64 family protein n=2 Tax=Exiguobacterium TaxID=33986 RepID=UPI000EDD5CBA|nr:MULTISPECIES: TVP38/TMEM64 family protein [unclassified Exiguobacterium]HAL01585.1 TVP38/TMEM64 family protein [Exiguobacterium sp.]